jgi:hypothetical protein
MNLVATTSAIFRGLVCFLFAALLAGGACLTLWLFLQGSVPFSNALFSLVAFGLAVWFAWFAVYDSALGRWMFAAVGGAVRFYLGCAVMLGLSVLIGYLCVHGFLTNQAPAFSRHNLWFSRSDHPEMFWVSMILHALLGSALLFSTLLVMRYRYKHGGEV